MTIKAEYNKERKRILNYIKKLEREGALVDIKVPDLVKRPTRASVNRLKKLSAKVILSKAKVGNTPLRKVRLEKAKKKRILKQEKEKQERTAKAEKRRAEQEQTANENEVAETIINNFFDRIKYLPKEFRYIVHDFIQRASNIYLKIELAKGLLARENEIDSILAYSETYADAAMEYCSRIVNTLPGIDEATAERLEDILSEYS